MSALLRILVPMVNVLAVVLIAQRRRMVRSLIDAGANTPGRAIPLQASGVSGWWLRRLSAAGVIQRTSDGRHWLDALALGRYRRARLIRVAIVVLLLLGAWAGWVFGPLRLSASVCSGVEVCPRPLSASCDPS